ncbi:MAG: 2-keto-3-deoxy-D-arabino-heptulosonate-7-phosphate synthase beta [Thermoleophilia bacterium]|nr:2-keto-3-deoxy-D-arabino-heptulosonate-7-phosphate synthase beta [Thermoleophilia bacterium]MCZ4496861.1 2-keto-3-deoxy-D-arabino-heptulosonate-7-phosphate synthase beta [Thermoleophilia bacterium]
MTSLQHRPGERRRVSLGDHGLQVGDGEFLVIGGPCSVESRDGLLRIAQGVADGGAAMLRGGAFKPRTSPHSFQGLGDEGLVLLADARARVGLPIVTEVLDVRDVARVAAVTDLIQVGARNMANGGLLREVARTGKPVLLKRGFGATVQELLDAAEYLLVEGNEDVLLVERGIRTFETATRFTLDIAAIPVLRERTHLPILMDPSHAAGVARWVPDLARAAAAVGADGIMVEVHDAPGSALSDAEQALSVEQFAGLVTSLDPILEAVGARRSSVSLSVS